MDSLANETVLVTGAAGFIGSFLCKYLLQSISCRVIGLDNMNDYYDPKLKEYRLESVRSADSAGCFSFYQVDIADEAALLELFESVNCDVVVNLAAQAGVRYSIENPRAYIDSNLIGFFNVLECCRLYPVKHLVYASSSSVYGENKKIPFVETDDVSRPVSLYAATKKSNELMAYSYSKLYGIPCTGLRFFTVYGPMGRPDMAYYSFAEKLVQGKSVRIFNMGNCRRDFTYIDDVVEGIARVMADPPVSLKGADGLPSVAHRLYNIGNSHPENLLHFVELLQCLLVEEGVLPDDYDFESHRELVPMQPGDVPVTFSDTTALEKAVGFKPETPLEEGLREFVKWFGSYHGE